MSAPRGRALLEALAAVPVHGRDAWVDALLGLPALPADAALPVGSVPYVPCEVDVIIAALGVVRDGDVFVDLGAGLGRPALLAHLVCGVPALGIELQPHLVREARAAAARLDVSGAVTFAVADAAIADLTRGTVFFIYASFNGPQLARVIARLAGVARDHAIVVCAVGFEVDVPWLRVQSATAQLVVYASRPLEEPPTPRRAR
ncbi:MAG TPA: hypothetical protein VK427_13370 [Kofleriaceae bacterium]|nr:hypothetical protein [Kofleriaceae bacterium]